MPSIKAVGMTLGQPAGLVQAGLYESTVVPLGPAVVAAPGVEVATNCWRPVPSALPLNGLYIAVVEALKFPERTAMVGIVTVFVFASWSLTIR